MVMPFDRRDPRFRGDKLCSRGRSSVAPLPTYGTSNYNPQNAAEMSTLANRPFVKMNGLGNEIVVVDMRPQGGRVSPAEARAVARTDGVRYDQLMVLYPSRTAGTDAYVCIYNNDGSESGACGNGMRCIAEVMFKETAKRALIFETKAGLLHCQKSSEPLTWAVDMGKPHFAWN